MNELKIKCEDMHTREIILNNITFSNIKNKNINVFKNEITIKEKNIEKLNKLHDEILHFAFCWNDIKIKDMYIN